MESSLLAIRTVIANDWPRMNYYKGEILKGITVCWCRTIEDSESRDLQEFRRLLTTTLKALKVALKDNDDDLAEVQEVLECDTRLRGLL